MTEQLPEGATLEESDGLIWCVNNQSPDYSLHLNAHERDTMPLLKTPPGKWLVDVGSHVGDVALRVARDGANVLCIDPNEEANRYLRASRKASEALINGNVDLLEVACWAYPTKLNIVRAGGASWDGRAVEDSNGSISAIALDSLCYEFAPGSIHVLKIDTEGSEGMVLAGAQEFLLLHQPFVLIETHPWLYKSIKLHRYMQEYLNSLGYVSMVVMRRGRGTKHSQAFIGAYPKSFKNRLKLIRHRIGCEWRHDSQYIYGRMQVVYSWLRDNFHKDTNNKV